MSIKYKILICFSILAIFFGFYGFKEGETRLNSDRKTSPLKKERRTVALEKQVKNEDMVAAILIMPKSYLPALKQFSQSAMARNIKILRAQLEIKDGKMTATRQEKSLKQQSHEKKPTPQPAETIAPVISKHSPDKKKQMISVGFLYLLASSSKHRFIR